MKANRALLTVGLMAMMRTPVSGYRTIRMSKAFKPLDFDKQNAAEAKRLRRQQRNLKNSSK